jgi:3'(2'), 5'-bisphosphate nucleotidase
MAGDNSERQVASDPLQYELNVALRLAQEAGDLILGYYGTGLPIVRKEGWEPVTEADRAADALIAAGLRTHFPGDGLLTEESHDDLTRLGKERVWIVDPLDGTAEFIDGTDEFAVQIALTKQGQPILGVVYQPTGRQLLYAVQGRGAYQVCGDRVRRLHVSAESDPARMCLVASRSHYSDFIEAARQTLGIGEANRMGSLGLKVGLVAQGLCDLYLATTLWKEWDVCAPHILLLEAGGMLTDLRGNQIVYNKAEVAGRQGLIASNGLAHAGIVEALAALLAPVEG